MQRLPLTPGGNGAAPCVGTNVCSICHGQSRVITGCYMAEVTLYDVVLRYLSFRMLSISPDKRPLPFYHIPPQWQRKTFACHAGSTMPATFRTCSRPRLISLPFLHRLLCRICIRDVGSQVSIRWYWQSDSEDVPYR
jgi:hypothetical protein